MRRGTAAAVFAGAAVVSTAAVAVRRLLSSRPPRPPKRLECSASTVVFGDPTAAVDAVGELLDPPVAKRDPYGWMRDDNRRDPEVLRHLELENEYTQAQTARLQPVRDALYSEFLSRTHESDITYPTPRGSEWEYYQRTVKGTSYPIVCRVRADAATSARAAACSTSDTVGAPDGEVVILDVNELAVGHEFCDVGDWEPSPSHDLFAYSVDFTGYETYTIAVKHLETGRDGDLLSGTSGTVVWGVDDTELYYLTLDDAHRPHKIWRHVLGTEQENDVCLLEENDERFWVHVHKSDDERYLIARSASTITSECSLLRLGVPAEDSFRVVQPRVHDMLYRVQPAGDDLLIVTNADDSLNFKLCAAPLATPTKEFWTDVLPHRDEVKLDSISCFSDFWAICGREDGLSAIWVMQPRIHRARGAALPELRRITPPEPVYQIRMSANYNFDASVLRYSYSSPTTPTTLLEFDPATGESKQLKRLHVPNHDPSLYRCMRGLATARDGRKIPISILFRPDAHDVRVAPPDAIPPDAAPRPGAGDLPAALPAPAPLLLYGYGSYGMCVDPSFSPTVISLVDRGIVYAIAHIRGGGEMGRAWYEREGKLLTKRNTFTDFVDCANALLDAGWAERGRLAMMGASAGGLLMGAVMNMAPELFSTVVARVPFVDVMSTMSDRSIPLTTVELDEWGDPHTKKFHDYMMSYSPIDNVSAKPYPHTLVTAGLNDSRVAYWEPMKWVATLRENTTSGKPILLKCEMGAGHFSASDRYRFLKERAFDYAFLVDSLGATEPIAVVTAKSKL